MTERAHSDRPGRWYRDQDGSLISEADWHKRDAQQAKRKPKTSTTKDADPGAAETQTAEEQS